MPRSHRARVRWSRVTIATTLLCLAGLYTLWHSRPVRLPRTDGQTLLSTAKHQVSDKAIVDLRYARYQGVPLAPAGVTQWLGIRYAAPPVGDLRWRSPQDPLPSPPDEVLRADTFGPICLGAIGPPLSAGANEDCLYLNIFAPTQIRVGHENVQKPKLLPVWFFIQGGGFAGNTDNNFNGTEAVVKSNHSIVFVQINYRVGVFGFLASEEMHRNRDSDLNAGLLDQRKALQWVRDYIHNFGGDPDHVIIHGDSAGAASVAYHMTAYGGRNDRLFVGAIAESPFWPTHRFPEEMDFQFNSIVDGAGCSDESESKMACLRSKDTKTIQRFNVPYAFPGAPGFAEWSFLPVIDGVFATDYLYTLFAQGKAVPVPLIVGDATDEGTSFAPDAETSAEFLTYIRNNFPKLSQTELETVYEMYPRDSFGSFPWHHSYFAATAAAYGEATFVCPGIQMADSLSFFNARDATWQYRYNVEDDYWKNMGRGVPHVSEKPAIFGPSKAVSEGYESYLTFNAPVVDIMMNYWLSFVQTLDPNSLKSPAAPWWEPWRPLDGKPTRIVIQLNNVTMEVVPSNQLDRCEKWKSWALITQQ